MQDLKNMRLSSLDWADKRVENPPRRKNSKPPEPMAVWVDGQECAAIHLTQGRFTIVDKEDAAELSKWKWHWKKAGYAQRVYRLDLKKRSPDWMLMHRVILNAPEEMFVDHINRNKLDNRRSNLRLADHNQNIFNSKTRKDNLLGVRGVRLQCGKYEARIQCHGKPMSLGRFPTLDEAVDAHRNASNMHFKEFSPYFLP